MNEIIFRVAAITIVIIVLLIAGYGIPYLKELLGEIRWNRLVTIIQTAVDAVEQTTKESGQGKAKKAQVLAEAEAWLEAHKVNISAKQIDNIIEAAVLALNKKS